VINDLLIVGADEGHEVKILEEIPVYENMKAEGLALIEESDSDYKALLNSGMNSPPNPPILGGLRTSKSPRIGGFRGLSEML
jgi:hypothetical protein